MWTESSASATLSRAMRNTMDGTYEDALRNFELLLKPDPDAYRFFEIYQHSYVILGATRLADIYPQARPIVEEWIRRNPLPF